MQMVTPSEATRNGISWISSALIGVLIVESDTPADGFKSVVDQNAQGIAVGDVALFGMVSQPVLDGGRGLVDSHVLGPQAPLVQGIRMLLR